jgi:hypothetical protein
MTEERTRPPELDRQRLLHGVRRSSSRTLALALAGAPVATVHEATNQPLVLKLGLDREHAAARKNSGVSR